jgi:NTE family protein
MTSSLKRLNCEMQRFFLIRITLLLLAFSGFSLYSQHYRNLALEGGGVRGIAITGALEVLDSIGWLKEMRQVAGTSAGSIQAMLLAAGYQPAEIRKFVMEVDFRQFNDGGYFFLGGGIRLKNRYGYYKGEALRDWLGGALAAKTGHANLNFRQLDSLARGNPAFRQLHVVVTDLSRQTHYTLSAQTTPEMEIRDAVRASCAIPFYYEPVVLNAKGRVIPADSARADARYLVDGGLVANYPYFVFDTFPGKTLGLVLEHPGLTDSLNLRGLADAPFPISQLTDYTEACYQIVLHHQKSCLTDEALRRHTAAISTGSISPRVRRLKEQEVQTLILNGRRGMHAFLQRYASEAK